MWPCVGSHDSRMCDTGPGGKLGDSWLTIRRILAWLLLIQLTVPSPSKYTCISLYFHIWELMFCKEEGVGRGHLGKQKMERHRMVSDLVRSLSGSHPQRRGDIRDI